MWSKSIGDIVKSRFWISMSLRPWASWRWWLSFAPTYVGTIFGLHIGLPFLVVVGHYREIKKPDTRLIGVNPVQE
jgi:hypothetical protein